MTAVALMPKNLASAVDSMFSSYFQTDDPRRKNNNNLMLLNYNSRVGRPAIRNNAGNPLQEIFLSALGM